MALCSVLAELRSEGTIRSMSPSFRGVSIRPVISVEQGNAESETTFMRGSGHTAGSRSFMRNPNEVSESFHDPGQLCLHQMMQPSAAKQMVPVTKTECNHPLYIAFWRSALDGCITYMHHQEFTH
ncbi:hypothetical protein PF008_g18575 [Phytophthora fragariae]|uniref:Uncharacterized protein n=1 Tax=Phytophthora fragariae TaxID=53985 RepID=A0A6G0R4X4_9STRA|nr:hypothetical protein PF008_g18575 [Phytophthora fragariae]